VARNLQRFVDRYKDIKRDEYDGNYVRPKRTVLHVIFYVVIMIAITIGLFALVGWYWTQLHIWFPE